MERADGLFALIRQDRERARLEKLAQPSMSNMFEVVGLLKKTKRRENIVDEEGNIIKVSPRIITHTFSGANLSSYTTEGLEIAVKQKLPTTKVGGEKYLSTIFQWDKGDKNEIRVSTCVAIPDEERDFKRIGDLRVDYLNKRKGFKEGVVDGNDDMFGIPTGEWYLDGNAFEGSLTRAYQVMMKGVFSVGKVLPLGSNPQDHNLLNS